MRRSFLTSLALTLMVGGCTFSDSPAEPPMPVDDSAFQASPNVPPSREALAADIERRKVGTPGLNRLGFTVFNALLSQGTPQNLALSPTSLGRALLMAYAGARESTREAMASALGMPDQSETTLAHWAAATGPSLDRRGVSIQVTDSAWVRANFSILPSFTDELRRLFSAEVGTFRDSADGTAKLRAWIKKASKGLLDGQGFELSDDVVLALADVITFDGRWDEIFQKAQTQPRPFFTRPSESRQVPMMQRAGEFLYAEEAGYQVIRLPYQESAYAMYVLLASDSVPAPAPIDAEAFERLADRLSSNQGQLLLPRFSMKLNVALTDALKASGMGLAFSDAANFDGIADNLRLDEVGQDVRVEVDEEGTVAAAATVLKAVPTSARVDPTPFHMEVNRPFYFAIREDATKAMLFMGKVVQPE
ncbi:hypothetical protein J7643_02115 [bacterium]|nr:hypothetical protein [bacterium]